MGQKINPIGFRIGVIRGFDSHWYYNKKGYKAALLQDHRIRNYIKSRSGLGNISRVEIERAANRIKVTIFTARPGAIIGKGGKGIDELTENLNRMVRREDQTMGVQVNVTEVRQPELDAQLVAEGIAQQLEKRISHRRAMRQAMTRCMRMNGRGIKVQVSGRLNGAEIARTEKDKVGKIPLHTLRADIDYGFAYAHTIYGSVGCKVWVYKGEVLPERKVAEMVTPPPARRKETEDPFGLPADGAAAAGEKKGEAAKLEVPAEVPENALETAPEAAPEAAAETAPAETAPAEQPEGEEVKS
jgi:small subunit ribosomal protein S3